MIVVWIPIVLYMPDLERLLLSLKLKVTKQRSIRFLAPRAIIFFINSYGQEASLLTP